MAPVPQKLTGGLRIASWIRVLGISCLVRCDHSGSMAGALAICSPGQVSSISDDVLGRHLRLLGIPS